MKAVIDTDIFLSGLLHVEGGAVKIMRAFRDGKFDLLITPEVFDEYVRVLHLFDDAVPYSQSEALLELVFEKALKVRAATITPGGLDPDNAKFFAAALAGGTAHLVTKNKKHFPRKHPSLKIVTAKNFLKELEKKYNNRKQEEFMAESLLEGKKILIVDDEPDVLETLEELLPMCEVVKAVTNAEARQHLEEEKFDLVVLDIMGVDGYNLLPIANRKNIPAVMLTANALSVQDTVKSFKLGAAYYVPKEKMGEITTYLEDVLEEQRKGKNLMSRWLDRLESYYDKRFGVDWKKGDPEFWEKFPYWY